VEKYGKTEGSAVEFERVVLEMAVKAEIHNFTIKISEDDDGVAGHVDDRGNRNGSENENGSDVTGMDGKEKENGEEEK
jgi:hypothetical protein